MSEDLNNQGRGFRLPGRELPESTREKLKQRRYRSRLSNLSRIVGPLKIFAFVLIIVSLAYLSIVQLRHLFFNTSYFELKSIEVTGNSTIAREEIINTAGISPALNVFLIDREAVRKRLINHPRIKNVKVELKGLYNLHLEISERVPALYAKVGTTFYEISDDGVIISTESLGEKALPIITGLKLETSGAGESLKDNDAFFIAQHWVKNLEAGILENISEINFLNPQNPYLYMVSGEKIFPRSLEDFKNRYNFLRALLDNLRKNNVEPIYLDMRAPSIVVKPRKKTGASEGRRGSSSGG
ncbi:MAG: cell division protein FtsQ/DivIB [Candidatus Rifleibacteriota bacterium]